MLVSAGERSMFIHFHLRLKPDYMLFPTALVQESNFFTIQGQDKFDQKVLNHITASPSDTNGLSCETR